MILELYLTSLFEKNFVRFPVSLIQQRLHGKIFKICTYLKWNVLHLLIMDILNQFLILEEIYSIPKYTQCQMWRNIYTASNF